MFSEVSIFTSFCFGMLKKGLTDSNPRCPNQRQKCYRLRHSCTFRDLSKNHQLSIFQKSSSAPSVTAKPKSEKEPKDLKSLSSTSNSNSLRVDESKPKVNVINFCFIFLNRKKLSEWTTIWKSQLPWLKAVSSSLISLPNKLFEFYFFVLDDLWHEFWHFTYSDIVKDNPIESRVNLTFSIFYSLFFFLSGLKPSL